MVHAHITLADSAGAAYGGHFAPGTAVFACEPAIEVLKEATPGEQNDEETALVLRPFSERLSTEPKKVPHSFPKSFLEAGSRQPTQALISSGTYFLNSGNCRMAHMALTRCSPSRIS